jgi:pectin methylesterase-like acyl-CoA thioesterase/pectate lyase
MKTLPGGWLAPALLGLAACASDTGPPASGPFAAPGTAATSAASPATAEPARPQMTAEGARRHTVANYLASPLASPLANPLANPRPQGPTAWQPLDEAGIARWRAQPADAVVAADGSGTHRTLQAALDAAPAAGTAASARRHVIELAPGHWRERPCVRGKAPLVLRGRRDDAARTVIVGGAYAALPKPAGGAPHACLPPSPATAHGTPGSATLVLASDDVLLLDLAVANDAMDAVRDGRGYPAGAGESGGAQAVALLTQADRVQLHQVHLRGHQDTFFARRPPGAAAIAPARVLVQGSLISGDVDYVFGDATLVISHSTLLSRAGRRAPGNGGHVLAPSTAPGQALGMLVTHSRFEAEPEVAPGTVSLGRAWDQGVPHGQWQPGVSPNGQALVRDSAIGPHIRGWARSTSRREPASQGPTAHRLREFDNRPLAPDAGRGVLPPDFGWAAAEGGTRGGADALPADVHEVHDRAGLLAALAPHARPRIVKLRGDIDLSVDAHGRPLGATDFAAPGFDWAAFEAAYDPATWGRRDPAGPLEDLRRQSARGQAAHVTVRVPSHTTLVGVPDAQGRPPTVRRGMLLLQNVQQVIVRGLHLSEAYDHFPAWSPDDNQAGEWNSEYDNLSLRAATHVWVDRNSFDDGPPQPGVLRLGRPVQPFDGLLDITRQSDHVTVSWNHFRGHDKTTLVGGSDRTTEDEGRLRVSFLRNVWEDTRQRSPRVRFGQVHVANNLYLLNDDAAFVYSIGVGLRSRVLAEHNAWRTPPALASHRLLHVFNGEQFSAHGSLHNGAPVDLRAAWQSAHPQRPPLHGEAGWQPPHSPALWPAAQVEVRLRGQVGAAALAEQSRWPVKGRASP